MDWQNDCVCHAVHELGSLRGKALNKIFPINIT